METQSAHPNQRAFQLLDVMRGLGFLMVVLTHCLEFTDLRDNILPQVSPVVDFFFLISGFVTGYANDKGFVQGIRTIRGAIIRRATRLLPLVFLGTLIGALPFFVRLMLWHDTDRLLSGLVVFLKGCLLIPTSRTALALPGLPDAFPFDVPVWFLFFDTLGFLLYLFCLRFLSVRWLIMLVAVSSFGLWHLALTRNTLNPGAWWPDLLPVAPRAFFDFVFGYLLFRLSPRTHWTLSPGWALGIGTLLLAALFAPLPATSTMSGAFQASVVTFLLPVLILGSVNVRPSVNLDALARLGARFSLAIYVIHFPVVAGIHDILKQTNHLKLLDDWQALLEGLVAIIVSYLAVICFDEPVQTWLRQQRAKSGTTQTQLTAKE